MTVTKRLERSAAQYPDKIAFADAERGITYEQLKDEAEKIGSMLAGTGIFKKPVCVLMEKSVACVSAMLGVLYSGNFYTVLDVEMPHSRAEKILEILQPAALVTDRKHLEQASEIVKLKPDLDVILYEDVLSADVNKGAVAEIAGIVSETDTMFVLFTSGSTGVPKGVVISHKAVSCYLDWLRNRFLIDETMVLGSQAPLYFVMTTLDVYLTIDTAASCHFIPAQYFSFPVMLLNYLKERHVNTLYWVPSAMIFTANIGALPEVHLDDLSLVLFGGEVMPVRQLNMWMREYPDVKFVNLYGATEITDIITYYIVDRPLDDNESLPIGKTAEHMQTLILDENNQPVPDGQTGELCGAGPSLADGYYHMPDKTREVFTVNPLYKEGDAPDMKRLYHMGDLVKLDKNGNLIYVGRKDYQIKHMGHRIELGEIETAVSSLEGVEVNCCQHEKKTDQIVLFYTGAINEDEVDSRLKGMLPDYMVPTRIEKLVNMPLNPNGKIDRVKLKELL